MKPISKDQAEYLINNGYLHLENGRFPDMSITSRQKSGKRKRRYVPDWMYYKFLIK